MLRFLQTSLSLVMTGNVEFSKGFLYADKALALYANLGSMDGRKLTSVEEGLVLICW